MDRGRRRQSALPLAYCGGRNISRVHLMFFLQFIRTTVYTPEHLVQEILEKVFDVMSSKSRPLRIHCIDYDRWPQDEPLPPPADQAAVDTCRIADKLQKDMSSMCEKTGDTDLHETLRMNTIQ